jgi:hypothetical protein
MQLSRVPCRGGGGQVKHATHIVLLPNGKEVVGEGEGHKGAGKGEDKGSQDCDDNSIMCAIMPIPVAQCCLIRLANSQP